MGTQSPICKRKQMGRPRKKGDITEILITMTNLCQQKAIRLTSKCLGTKTQLRMEILTTASKIEDIPMVIKHIPNIATVRVPNQWELSCLCGAGVEEELIMLRDTVNIRTIISLKTLITATMTNLSGDKNQNSDTESIAVTTKTMLMIMARRLAMNKAESIISILNTTLLSPSINMSKLKRK